MARRLDGVLQGERRGRRPGPGDEPSLTRPYAPGDDVRWIDWRLSARVGAATVRVPEIAPVLTAWALVDCSPSMAFGSVSSTKLDLAREVLAAIGLVLRRRGDRLGVLATTAGGPDLVRPPRSDRRALIATLAALDAIEPLAGERTDLAAAVTVLGRLARHRGLAVILSDLPLGAGLERAIGTLARRHEVLVVEVRDQRERDLPAMGPLRLRDLETGASHLIDTDDPRFRERFAQLVGADERHRAAMLARSGARHVSIETGADWVAPLVRALSRPPNRSRVA